MKRSAAHLNWCPRPRRALHFSTGVYMYDGEEALPVLEQCVEEMERRYKLLQQRGVDHVRKLTGADAVPRWVVAMDEFEPPHDLRTRR